MEAGRRVLVSKPKTETGRHERPEDLYQPDTPPEKLRELIIKKKAYLEGAERVLCGAEELVESCRREVEKERKEIVILEELFEKSRQNQLEKAGGGNVQQSGPKKKNDDATKTSLIPSRISMELNHHPATSAGSWVMGGISALGKAIRTGANRVGARPSLSLPAGGGGFGVPLASMSRTCGWMTLSTFLPVRNFKVCTYIVHVDSSWKGVCCVELSKAE